eukprot:g16698.t1
MRVLRPELTLSERRCCAAMTLLLWIAVGTIWPIFVFIWVCQYIFCHQTTKPRKHTALTTREAHVFRQVLRLSKEGRLDEARRLLNLEENRYAAWRKRSWLVMLRAHHQQSSLGHTDAGKRKPESLVSIATTGVGAEASADDGDGHRASQEMEDCEEGESMSRFASAVKTVVEMENEDTFRHIVTYL